MQKPPFFSIIIPTYNRPKQLAACLQSLARLDYPRDHFEIIVVDDGSEAPPDDVVAPFHDRLDVTLLTQPHAGPAAARNTGAARAEGKFLAFIDDDCKPAANWLQTLALRFAQTSDYAIGGRTLNVLLDNPYSTVTQTLIDYLYTYYNVEPNQARFFASNNLNLPADCFRAIGGFDTTFPLAAGEDRDFCARWLYHGYRIIYAPEVLVYHAHALTFRTFWRQHFNYGRGAFHFHQLRAQRNQTRIRVEPKSFYLDLLRYPFSQTRGWRALWVAGLLIVSQVANATGFFREKLSNRER
ncbi:glycosyltransferase [bacterium]|nr:glycosyltransferase [bacterium]